MAINALVFSFRTMELLKMDWNKGNSSIPYMVSPLDIILRYSEGRLVIFLNLSNA